MMLFFISKYRVKKANEFITQTLRFVVSFFLICTPGFATSSSTSAEQNALREYYAMLESMGADSLTVQISKLQNFVKRFPEFERGYLQLQEKYISNDQIEQARVFFTDLFAESLHQRNSHWMLAKIYSLQNDLDAAMEAFMLSLRAAPPSPPLLEDFLRFDHQHFRKFNDPKYRDKISLDEKTQNLAIALLNFIKSDYRKAAEQFNELPKTASHHPAMLYNWGKCRFRLAQYQRADSLWQIGLALSREKKDLEFEAKFLIGLANVPKTYQTPKAIEYLDSSYAIANRIGDLKNMALLAGNRGIIYRRQGDYSLAEELFIEAIHVSRKLKSYRNLAVWYSHYGKLFVYMKRFDEALKAYDRCEEMAKKTKDQRRLIQTLYDKGELYRFMGQNELAKIAFKNAYKAANEKGLRRLEQWAMLGLGDIHFIEREYKAARKTYQEYIIATQNKKGYATDRAYCFIKLGRIAMIEENYDLARQEFQRAYRNAKEGGAEHNMIWSFIYLGELDLLTNDLSEAEKKYQSCLEMVITKKDSSTLPTVYVGLGDVYKKLGELTQAIKHYRKAADIIEKTRANLKVEAFRVEYFVDASQVYNKLIDCYYQVYNQDNQPSSLEKIYTYLELTRGRTLRDLKLQTNINITDNIEEKQLAVYIQVCNQLKKKQRYLREKAGNLSDDKLESILSEIEISRYSLIAQRFRLMNIYSKPGQLGVSLIQPLSVVLDNLNEQDLGLLLYHISEEGSFVLIAFEKKVELVPLQIDVSYLHSNIHSLITPFHSLDKTNILKTSFKAKIAHELYTSLIKPLEQAVTLPKNLLIVPEIALMNLPFEMLLTKAPKHSEFTPLDRPTYARHFLQQRYTITYSPTTSLLKSTSKWKFSQSKVLVFANPFGETPLLADKQIDGVSNNLGQSRALRQFHFRTGWRLEPLPFAEVEARRISEISPSTKIHTQTNATKSYFIKEAEKYDVIHIATHAFVDTIYDAFSGLVFSVGNDTIDDGLLMGYEISDLNLNSDLITLSACETGRGKLVAGEGVLGLPRLFLSAGAKSVLLTHWKVDDLFSSKLMPDFYRQYLENGLSKAEALAEAKRNILNESNSGMSVHYQHPVFWASFTLFGDPGVNQINVPTTNILLLVILILLANLIWLKYRHHRQLKSNI